MQPQRVAQILGYGMVFVSSSVCHRQHALSLSATLPVPVKRKQQSIEFSWMQLRRHNIHMHIALSRFIGIIVFAWFFLRRWQLETGALQFENRIPRRFQWWHWRREHHISVVQMLIGGGFVVRIFSAKFDVWIANDSSTDCQSNRERTWFWVRPSMAISIFCASVCCCRYPLYQFLASNPYCPIQCHPSGWPLCVFASPRYEKWKLYSHLFACRCRSNVCCNQMNIYRWNEMREKRTVVELVWWNEEWIRMRYSLYVTRTFECILCEFVRWWTVSWIVHIVRVTNVIVAKMVECG